MFISCFLLSALLLSSANSVNPGLNGNDHKNKSISGAAAVDMLDKTNITLVSEGGTIKPNNTDISLAKADLNSLVSLENEFPKTKQKSVVARKGVDMPAVDIPSTNMNQSSQNDSKSSSTPQEPKTPAEISNVVNKQNITSESEKQNNITSESTTALIKNKPVTVIKKPTILSYDALAKMETNIQSDQAKISVAPSTKTMASSQIPSPNEDSIPKVYPSKANSHPGMIMPIVITILVVPMFAIVGYMALKRGQEAWKNRHYKRMDFLLDGMYND